MMNYHTILKIEGFILTCAGIAHLVYMFGFATTPLSEPAAIGGILFGILYFFFGINMLRGKSSLLLITLIINVIGLTAVLIVRESSPLWEIDPYLIVVDLISIPTLIYLNIKSKKGLSHISDSI